MLSPLNQSLVRAAADDITGFSGGFAEFFLEEWEYEAFRRQVEDRLERLIEEVEKAK